MTKPTHWIVHHAGKREYFANRTRARIFAASRRMLGESVTIEAKGF